MTRQRKIWLGVLTFLPVICFIIYFLTIFLSVFAIAVQAEELEGATSDPGPPMGFFISMIFGVGVMVLGVLAGLGTWVYYLIHAANYKGYKDDNERLLWLLVLVFLNFIGTVVYWYLRIWKEPEPSGVLDA